MLMLSVTIKSIMLSVIMLNVLATIKQSSSLGLLNCILLLSIIIINKARHSAKWQNSYILRVRNKQSMLNVLMLGFVMLNVVAPLHFQKPRLAKLLKCNVLPSVGAKLK
jgi:hypothetical protein